MAYKVLSLKWRPQSFQDVVGQDHVTQTLVNAFKQNRIGQGYIFTGPRGVGKTTTARILSMAMNAEGGPNSDFDSNSEVSKEISGGRSLDVLEIDGASNRGIEEIRNLREQIKFSPMNCTYKVVIIDEVHMLTNQAFNALLRTLEEPPMHGKFIFATTDIHKVPATIISRCQRFDFNRISINIIAERISMIIKSEKIECDSESIYLIAKKADGSMRDALSILDQSISYCGEKITYEKLVEALGIIDHELYFDFTKSVRTKDYSEMMTTLSKFSKYGVPASEVLVGIQEHIRNLIYSGVEKDNGILEMNKDQKKLYVDEYIQWERRDLFRMNQVIIDTSAVIRRSDDPYLLFEMTALKLLEMDRSVLIDQLLSEGISSSKEEVVAPLKKENAFKNVNEKEIKIIKQRNDFFEQREDNKSNSSIEKEFEKSGPKNLNKENSNPVFEINFETIKGKWSEILETIHRVRPSVGSIIEDFTPYSIDEDILTLNPTVKQGYNEKVLERGIPVIEKEIKEIVGLKIKVKFKTNDYGKRKTKNKPNENRELNPEDDKVFDKIVDLFDGEILH